MSTPYLLPHLIDQAAESHADRVAVVFAEETITYGDLATRSAKFASAASGVGVRRGIAVGVHANKSIDTVVAIHGIQRAGAIAVPIDPMASAALLNRTAADIGLGAIVVDAAHSDRSNGSVPVVVGHVGPDTNARTTLSWADIESSEPSAMGKITGDDPAYMITTSGSTGSPKAIVHTHTSGLRYAQLAASTYDLGPEDKLANVAPFHFDQSTFELYAAPAACASTTLIPEIALRFPAELSNIVDRNQLTVWYSVPTILMQLLHRGALSERNLQSLRWVLFGGEIFPSGPLAQLMGLLPNARFSNVYGPAEVNQCTHQVLTAPPSTSGPLPIGRPWGDTEARLVESELNSDSGRDRGELHVKSSTMMAGYWNRRDLSDMSIRTEVDEHGLQSRWYRTGDIVERDEAGVLYFCGRVDRQVKVRGNRIELEAVEAAVCDTPGVIAAAAVTLTRGEDQILVAVIESEHEVEAAAIRACVRDTLATYAVPDEVVTLTKLPRTHSGKIDNRAAADMARAHLEETSP